MNTSNAQINPGARSGEQARPPRSRTARTEAKPTVHACSKLSLHVRGTSKPRPIPHTREQSTTRTHVRELSPARRLACESHRTTPAQSPRCGTCVEGPGRAWVGKPARIGDQGARTAAPPRAAARFGQWERRAADGGHRPMSLKLLNPCSSTRDRAVHNWPRTSTAMSLFFVSFPSISAVLAVPALRTRGRRLGGWQRAAARREARRYAHPRGRPGKNASRSP